MPADPPRLPGYSPRAPPQPLGGSPPRRWWRPPPDGNRAGARHKKFRRRTPPRPLARAAANARRVAVPPPLHSHRPAAADRSCAPRPRRRPPPDRARANGRDRSAANPCRSDDHGEAAHIGLQDVRHGDAPVLILIIFHDRDQRTADRETRAVQGMHQLRLAGLGIAPARLQAPRLEVLEVAARRNFSVFLLARQPYLDVVSLGGRKTHVATAEHYHAIG